MKTILKNASYGLVMLITLILGLSACKKDKKPAEVITVPELSTNAVNDITQTSAISGATISSTGGADIVQSGICWGTSANPTIDNNPNKTTDGILTLGDFTSIITGLTINTTYYVRAYATNSVGTAYGQQQQFTTGAASIPTLTTSTASNITSSSATSGGFITNNGGSSIIESGICWSTSPNPVIDANLNKVVNTSQIDGFSLQITNLSPNTTYYVRAYATNSIGTAYGEQWQFITLIALPNITTNNSITNITTTSATSGGDIVGNGGDAIFESGICWSTGPNPTPAGVHVSTNGITSGSFTLNMSGLNPGTNYYVRAYAINQAGTAYGSTVMFTTNITTPSLTTNLGTINGSTTEAGGTIINNGGGTITESGICWSTNSNPTEADTKITNTVQSGSFTSLIKNLTIGTTYYVRAYAKNAAGIAYGQEATFVAGAQ